MESTLDEIFFPLRNYKLLHTRRFHLFRFLLLFFLFFLFIFGDKIYSSHAVSIIHSILQINFPSIVNVLHCYPEKTYSVSNGLF